MKRFQQVSSLTAVILYIVYSAVSVFFFTLMLSPFDLGALGFFVYAAIFYSVVGIFFVVPIIIRRFRGVSKITFSYRILLILFISQFLLLLLFLVNPPVFSPHNTTSKLYEIGVLPLIGNFIIYSYPLLFLLFLYRTLCISERLERITTISSESTDREYDKIIVTDIRSILAVLFIALVISLWVVINDSSDRKYDVAVLEQDVKKCESLKNVIRIPYCIQTVAVRTADPLICDKILSYETSYSAKKFQENCYIYVMETNNFDIPIERRKNKIDEPSICDKITWSDLAKKEKCYVWALHGSDKKEDIYKYCSLMKTEWAKYHCDFYLLPKIR